MTELHSNQRVMYGVIMLKNKNIVCYSKEEFESQLTYRRKSNEA